MSTLKVHEHRNAVDAFKDYSASIFDRDQFIDSGRGQAGCVNGAGDAIFPLGAVRRNPIVKQLEDSSGCMRINIRGESSADQLSWLQFFGGLSQCGLFTS